MKLFTFQHKIFFYFSLTVVILGVLTLFLGTYLISKRILDEAQDRVTLNLQTADSFYMNHMQTIYLALGLISEQQSIVHVLQGKEKSEQSQKFLQQKRANLGLDFLSLCDAKGKVLVRTRSPYVVRDSCLYNPLIQKALEGEGGVGTVILSQEVLEREGEGLSSQAYVSFIDTPRAKYRTEQAETSGMSIMAAVPVMDSAGEQVIGVLYGGSLLNRNYALVDYIRDMIFEEKEYEGRELGTVTIFQWDVRVSTNVLREDSTRAIGTRVSEEVYQRVLEEQKLWLGRAFVVHDWYISAYKPIFDPNHSVIGILYVGILEDKYIDIRNGLLLSFLPLTIIGLAVVLLFSYILSRDLSHPVQKLVQGTEKIASGDLSYRISGKAKYLEIEQLNDYFNRMAQALKEREEELKDINENLRRVNRNYMEMLGFVSHEMKSALTNMLMSSYNLRDGAVGAITEKQKIIAGILVRNCEYLQDMIKNYLDLSRIEKGELKSDKQVIDFETHVLSPVLDGIAGQLKSKEMKVIKRIPESYKIKADPDLLKIILENLLTNAIKYGKSRGEIRIGASENSRDSQISVWNEGQGIPAGEFPHLFSRFIRLKTEKSSREKGSGLGLFITKEMVEKQGGRIWVESKEGQWTKFSFILPK